MKRILLSSVLLAIAGNVYAQPPFAFDVNVTNESLGVTVDNPQTEVEIINDSANPVPVVVQGAVSGSSEPRFVGFSNDMVQGNAGLVGVHEACENKFGSGARMCSTAEVFKTPGISSYPDVAKAWVQPDSAFERTSDVPYGNNCYGWSTSTNNRFGSVFEGQRMNLESDICSRYLPVTCCK